MFETCAAAGPAALAAAGMGKPGAGAVAKSEPEHKAKIETGRFKKGAAKLEEGRWGLEYVCICVTWGRTTREVAYLITGHNHQERTAFAACGVDHGERASA